MGLFDWLTGNKSAAASVARISTDDLRAALLALNRSTAPFVVRDGAPEGCDLVAEWNIVDARWYEIFAKASLSKVAQVLMRFDAASGEIRAVDRDYTVEWRAGVPSLALHAEAFRGQKTEISFGTAYAFTENLQYGQVYQYRFTTKELKGPLQEIAAKSGWGWKGIAFGKL